MAAMRGNPFGYVTGTATTTTNTSTFLQMLTPQFLPPAYGQSPMNGLLLPVPPAAKKEPTELDWLRGRVREITDYALASR